MKQKRFFMIILVLFFLTSFSLPVPVSSEAALPHTVSAPGTASLKILKVIPSTLDGLINPDASFAAAFDRDLDANTVDAKFVSLSGNGSPVPVEVKYIRSAKTITVKPLKKLAYDSEYRLVFKTGLADRGGKRLPAAMMYQYYTISSPDRPAIKVSSVFPANGAGIVEEKPLIYAAFDQKMAFEKDADLTEHISLYQDRNKIPLEINSFDRILLTFSESISPRTSFDDFIKISDASDRVIPGKYHVYGPASVIFIPEFPFYSGNYRVFISKDFSSLHANDIMKDVTIPFTVKSDHFNSGEFSNEKK